MSKISKIVAGAFLTSVLMVTNGLAAANEIVIDATVDVSMVAGMQAVDAELGTGFIDGAANAISLGAVAAGGTHTPVSQDIFLKTNNAAGASLTFTDPANGGALVGSGADIPVVYSIDGANITLGTPISISASANDGTTTVGAFTVTPAATAGNQAGGPYGTTLTVLLSAN